MTVDHHELSMGLGHQDALPTCGVGRSRHVPWS